MKPRDALALLEGAVPRGPGVWADLGAGKGTFTRALAELLGRGGRIYAVDRDGSGFAGLTRWAFWRGVDLVPVRADFAVPFELPGLAEAGPGLDGLLLANSLHYVAEPTAVLEQLAKRLRPGGRVVLVEYDHRPANRWVPYPIASVEWPSLAGAAGLVLPRVTASTPSTFGGDLYVAAAERAAA